MVSLVLATNQIFIFDDELPPEGRDHTLAMHIVVRIMCPQKQYYAFLFDNKILFSHS